MNTNDTINAYDKSAHQFDEKIASLPNYLPTYQELSRLLPAGSHVLDLACGPGNISRFLIAQPEHAAKTLTITAVDLSREMLALAQSYIPSGTFICDSIVDVAFPANTQFDAIINGFGLPYLDETQTAESITNAVHYLKKDGLFYLSFMQGNETRIETPSFNPDIKLEVHYHDQNIVTDILKRNGLMLLKTWNLDYRESDGTITTDVVLIARKTQ